MTTKNLAVPLPRYRTWLGLPRQVWVQYSTLILTAVLVLAPILPILYQSLIDRPLYDAGGVLTLQNYVNLFTDAEFDKVVVNSLIFGVLTTVLSVTLGTLLAVLIGRTNLPGARFLGDVLLWPMYLSPLVLAFGWVLIYGPSGYITLWVQTRIGTTPWNLYTIPGMALVAAVSQVPLAYLYCSSSVRVADASLEDAARVSGAKPMRVLRTVTLPLLRPPILYSAILIFSSALEMLSIPLILGRPVGIDFFASFLYVRGLLSSTPDYGILGAAAMLLLLIATALLLVQIKLLGNTARFVSLRGKATRPRLFDLGPLRWVAAILVWLYILLGAVVPVLGLIARAFTSFLTPLVSPLTVLTMDNVKLIFSYPVYVRSITNSLIIAVLGGIVTTLFVLVVVLVSQRSKFRPGRALEFLALSPRAMPGIIISIGFFWAFVILRPLGPLRNTIFALLIAFSVRYIPTSYGAVSPMLMRVSSEIDQAARTVGADWWTTSTRILARLVTPALYASFVLVFIQLIKEYSAAAFLVAPGSEVMGLTTLQFWMQGDTGPVAALAVIQVLITAAVVFIGRRILGVRTHA